MIMKISVSRKLYSFVFILVLLLISFMPFLSCKSFTATRQVDYFLKAESCDKDRLFNVDVYVEGKTNLAAIEVAITFDSNYMEFRRVYGANDAFEIQHKQSDGKISTIMLCSYGYSFSGKAKLMTFQFKSLKSGNTIINTHISDPVNKDLNSIPVGNVYGCLVTINGDKIKSDSVKITTEKQGNLTKNNKNKEESVKNKKENIVVSGEDEYTDKKVNSVDEENDYEVNEDIQEELIESEETSSPDLTDNENNTPYLPYVIGAIIVVIIVLIIYISYRLGRNNQNSDRDNKDNDTEQ